MSWFYRNAVRPVLFSQDAESIHNRTMGWLSWAGRNQMVCEAMRSFLGAPELPVELFGLRFPNPVGLAAGMDKNAVALPAWAAMGFGFTELGAATWHAQPGNPQPRVFRAIAEEAIVNRMGFNNRGAEAAARRLRRVRRRARHRAVIGVNIGKSRVVDVADATADYVRSTTLLAPLADYLAVNVSSPNTPGLRGLQAVQTLRPLLQAVQDAAAGTPLLVKIAPDLPDDEIDAVARLAVELGLAGIIVTNTTISRAGLATDPAVVAAAGEGGLSGAPLKARSLEVLRRVRAVVPAAFTVISVGGVETADDVRERLDAGADLVQGYTAFLYRGPLWARQVNRGLRR